MGGPQNRQAALLAEAVDVLHDRAAAVDVEADRRLVEDQEPRLVQEGARQLDPPAQAAAQRAHQRAPAVGDAQALQLLGDPLLGLAARQPLQARPHSAGSARR